MATDAPTGTSADAIELLTSQHREVEQLWSQVKTADETDAELRKNLAQRAITLLSQHDALETQLLYPALRKAPGGDELADQALEDHREIRVLLAKADEKDPSEPEVFEALSQALASVEAHVAEEEGVMFPRVREAIGQEGVTDLGQQMAKMLPVLPTHPHPTMPNNPLGAAAAGIVAGAVDKVKDAIKR